MFIMVVHEPFILANQGYAHFSIRLKLVTTQKMNKPKKSLVSTNFSADAFEGVPRGEAVYRHIKESIQDGRLNPGDRVREGDLAASFGLSRTPVREALARLEADGLIMNHPTMGLMVPKLDYGTLTELYFMRELLEGAAARLAARHASEVEISILEELCEQYKNARSAEDPQALVLKNAQFHDTLCHSSHNRYLVKSIKGLHNALSVLGRSSLTDEERVAETIQEHEQIIAAIRDRDPEAAEAAMQTHIRAAQKTRMKKLFS